VHAPVDAATYALQRRVYERAAAGGDALFVEEGALELLHRVTARAYGAPRACAGQHREAAEAVRVLLARRFREPLPLAAIARAVGWSPFALARAFRSATGTSIHRHRTELRLYASLERVLQRGSDLTEIALDVGFSSHSHFTSAFRAAFGVTPAAMRARGRVSASTIPTAR
jgi:AraC-like DNA-binding protein